MDRLYIGIFGRTNAGKSTLLNLLAGGQVAVTSPVAGTTTDAVRKNGEILGLGAVTYIDTAGSDDTSVLGARRVEGTRAIMEQVDIALLVYRQWGAPEEELLRELGGVPVVLVHNVDEQRALGASETQSTPRGAAGDIHHAHCQSKSPAADGVPAIIIDAKKEPITSNPELHNPHSTIHTNVLNGDPAPIFEAIKAALPPQEEPSMFGDRIAKGDRVVLVMPQDSEAPAGRLILPQVQAIRELLDKGAIVTAVQPGQLAAALQSALAPKLVVTDSQVISQVRKVVKEHFAGGEAPGTPPMVGDVSAANESYATGGGGVRYHLQANGDSPMTLPEITSFSILLAASRGDRELYERGLQQADRLKDGDRILIAESCTHQSSCDDIGRVKIPRWLREYTGKRLEFDTVSGLAPLPADLSQYAMAVQCGGCMVSRRQLLNRLRRIAAAGVPVTNYGMLINKITE